MAIEEVAVGDPDTGRSSFLEPIIDAYDELDMPVRQYLGLIVLPSLVFFAVTIVVGIKLPVPLGVRLPVPLLGLLTVTAALIYPKLVLEGRRQEIEDRFHLLITHMTVLSTTNIDRMEVFRTLAREEEYGALADEIGRIVLLVDTWNQSLDEACRRRAARVPSEPFSDFLSRLSYSLSSGQQLSEFLLSEQDVVIQQFSTAYEGALDNLEVMKDLYLSMVLSMTFALVFAVVLPVLTGESPMLIVGAVIVLYMFVQAGFGFTIRSLTPDDPVWYHPEDIATSVDRLIGASFAAAFVSVAVLFIVAFGGLFEVLPVRLEDFIPRVESIPIVLYAAIPLTPLAIPGLVVMAEERRIKQRDGTFPSFIRALGGSESAKQSTTTAVLHDLRHKDFGPLTDTVNDLYKRLNIRIEPSGAWHYFAADTRSYLIQKFSEMYLTGRQMGGDPKRLGELISENMSEVLQLRSQRRQTTTTLIGLLYGITGSSTFAFFIGLKIVGVLSDMTLSIDDTDLEVTTIIHTETYNVAGVEYLLILVVLFNALSSALLIRTVDDGHKVSAYFHFVMLAWLGALIAVLTKTMVGALFGP